MVSLKLYAQPCPPRFPYDISYLLPQGQFSYNPEIPTPAQVLGFEIGQQHVDWEQVLNYMKTLARLSDRVTLKEFGKTYQNRPFIQVTFTSAENQKNLEKIRQEHLQLTDPVRSLSVNTDSMPVVSTLFYSIHGNESSGVNASLAVAYFLAAARGEEIDRILSQAVINICPGLNPDGINRFAAWVNSSRSYPDVSDPNSREFTEPWPSSRTNHYWADCNRDWLMVQHPEGQNSLEMFFDWLPNTVSDHHEQGGDRSFFFQPGFPARTNPLTPKENWDITYEISKYHAAALDKIGTLYYSREGYDDFYYGKGASYPDIHGGIAMLFEQTAVRGHLRDIKNGLTPFIQGIRNQAYTSYSTIRAAVELRTRLLNYQRNYFINSQKEARKNPVKGYIVQARGGKAIMWHFLNNLKRHRIVAYPLTEDRIINGHTYKPGEAYIIPSNQKYYTTLRTLMEKTTHYTDSVFYDISTWTFPLAYNLQYDELRSLKEYSLEKEADLAFPAIHPAEGPCEYAYAFENKEYYTPKLIYELLRAGLILKTAQRPFTYSKADTTLRFGYGTVIVPVQNQMLTSKAIYTLIDSLSRLCAVPVYALESGMMQDHDLGSSAFAYLRQPRIVMIVGRGMGIPQSGEIWYMLDQRFQMPPVLIEYTTLEKTELNSYNTLILANGSPTLSPETTERIQKWVTEGGLLILTQKAYKWANENGITLIKTEKEKKTANREYQSYISRLEANAGNAINGVILNSRLDPSHPIGWGYEQNEIAIFKQGKTGFAQPENPYMTPLSYQERPLLSGCLSEENNNRLSGQPGIIAGTYGKGQIIVFADDMNFRSYWFGTNKLFMNAILFGYLIKTGKLD